MKSCVFKRGFEVTAIDFSRLPSPNQERWKFRWQNIRGIFANSFPSQFDLIYNGLFCALHREDGRNMPNVSHSCYDRAGSLWVLFLWNGARSTRIH